MAMRRQKGKGKIHYGRGKQPRPTTAAMAVGRNQSMNLQAFKAFNTDRADVDEMVAGLAFGKSMRAEYDALQIDEPEYIDRQIKSLRREIAARNADNIAARKRELAARIDALKSPTQKRAELEAELKKLEAVGV